MFTFHFSIWRCILKNLNRLLRIYKTLVFVVFLVIRGRIYLYIYTIIVNCKRKLK